MSDVRRSAGWLADKLAEQDRRLNLVESRKPGLAQSSVEDGAIDEFTADGTFASSVGKQPDGSHVAFPATGPKPATPVKATLKSTPGLVEVRWSGKFENDDVSTLDFKHVAVHASNTPDVDISPAAQLATIRGELGDVASIVAEEGMLYVVLVAWTAAGKASDPSQVAAVAVAAPADANFIQEALTDLDTKYDGVVTEAGQLGGRLNTAETDLIDHETRLQDADQQLADAFGQLGTVDARTAAAKQAAIDAAAADATYKKEQAEATAAADAKAKADAALAAAKTDAKAKADAAQAAAIAAAAADATAKQELAEANAATAAAADAQAKADAAEAAALAAAKTYADAQASGASGDALDAAKADATAKADAAKAAAITAAAADGTAKKEQAEANAAADAKTKADAALANAKTDATTKSDAAKAAAITAAAADATAKKEQAEANAAADAKTKADAALAAAKADATTKADAAKAAAITAAAADAQTKADAARQRAEDLWALGMNLLQDAGFEGPAKLYTNSLATVESSPAASIKVVTDATKAHSGNSYLEMSAPVSPATSTTAHLKPIPVSPDRTYRIGVWVYAELQPDVKSFGMPFYWIDKNDALINNTWPRLFYWVDFGSKLTVGAWKYMVADITPPAGAVKMGTRFYIDNSNTNTKIRIDDVTVVDATEALAAQAAADAAQATANAAQTAAGNAQGTATDALTMAGTKSTVYYSTAVATGTGSKAGDLWRQRNASNEIIAEWQWSGTSWVKQTVSGSNVSNMDIGFLTAGGATIAQAVINKLVAATAAFQTVDVANLFATNSTMSQAVIDKLWADVIHAYKITTDMLLVSKSANLLTDPDIQDVANWSGGYASTTGGKNGKGSILLPMNSSQTGSYYGMPGTAETPADVGIRLVSGSTYRVGAWIRASVDIPANQVKIYMRIYDGVSTAFDFADDVAGSVAQNTAIIPANSWAWVSGMMKVPDDVANVYGVLGLYKQASFTTSAVRWSDPAVQQATAGELLVDGTVTAAKLVSLLVLASEVIAGNPNGTHAKMTPNGFRVMAAGLDGGAPVEVIRLGTDTDDYLGVVNAAQELVASISSTGGMTAQELDVAGDVVIAGTSALERFDQAGGSIIARASRGTDGLYYAGTTPHPYLSLQVDGIRGGRAYMVQTSPIGVTSDSANSDAVVNLHYQSGADRAATTSDPIIMAASSVPSGWSTAKRNPATINRLVTPSADGTMALLLSYGVESTGRAKITTGGGRSVFLTVTDMGPSVPETGEDRNGTSNAASGGSTGGETTAPVSKKNYDKTWPANAIQSYLGSGGQYNYSPHMYSGNGPISSNGDLMSIAVFPDVKSEIGGGTVTGVWVYVYYDFWWYGAGGNAYIGLHGQLGVPGTKPAKTYSHAVVNNWPRAAGKWIKMSSSTYAGWASGTHRGFTLGGSGGGLERYGYAHDARLRITWTK